MTLKLLRIWSIGMSKQMQAGCGDGIGESLVFDLIGLIFSILASDFEKMSKF